MLLTECTKSCTGMETPTQKMSASQKKRLAWRKGSEFFLRRGVHNIRQYSYLRYTEPGLVEPIGH